MLAMKVLSYKSFMHFHRQLPWVAMNPWCNLIPLYLPQYHLDVFYMMEVNNVWDNKNPLA